MRRGYEELIYSEVIFVLDHFFLLSFIFLIVLLLLDWSGGGLGNNLEGDVEVDFGTRTIAKDESDRLSVPVCMS